MEDTAATLQAVYLVWLFLRITTTCNLSIIGLVRKKFPELFAHAVEASPSAIDKLCINVTHACGNFN